MLKKLTWLKLFPLLLGVSLLIGIISNLVMPADPRLSALVIISCGGCIYGWSSWSRWTDQLTPKNLRRILFAGGVVIIIVQLLVLHFLPATVYHDPFRVLYQAERLSRGNTNWQVSTYFWRYPNNVDLAFLIAQWLKLTTVLGLTTNTAIHILSMLFLDGLIGLTFVILLRTKTRNSLILTVLAFYLFSPFAYSYYLQVFYSDLPILLCLLVIFDCLTQWPQLTGKGKVTAGILIVGSALLGQMLKPNLIVLAIACLVVIIALVFNDRRLLVKLLLPLTLLLLGFAATIPTEKLIDRSINFSRNTQYQVPVLHWVWMSYNPSGTGAYVGKDVQKMNRLPNKQARQQFAQQDLPKRLRKLGPSGIIKRWLLKIGILLNVGRLQKSYTGGFIGAPSGYQKYQAKVSLFGQLFIRVGIILLYGWSLMKCWLLLRAPKRIASPMIDLLVITAVGYLAFHTLLWEAEGRYGQPILSLLLLLDVCPTLPDHLPVRLTTAQRTAIFSGIGVLAGVLLLTVKTPLINNDHVVAAQRSQVSAQYHAPLTTIAAKSTVTQDLQLNHVTTKISLLMPKNTRITAKLINLQNQHSYKLQQKTTAVLLKRRLDPGQYRIVFSNQRSVAQKLWVVKTQRYQLAPYAVKINGKTERFASLVYTCRYRGEKA
jgi:hypothetical protein